MLDVYAEHGGVVIGLIDVGAAEISKYGCVVPADGSRPGRRRRRARRPGREAAGRGRAEHAGDHRPLRPAAGDLRRAARRPTRARGGEIQLTDAMRDLAAVGTPVHGVVFRGRRYDTGDRLDYVKAVVQLAVRHPDIGADFRAWLREYEPDDG